MATNLRSSPSPAGRKSKTEEQLVEKVLARVAAGETVKAACDALGIAVPTYYRWRAASPQGIDAKAGTDSRDAIFNAAKKLFLRDGFGVSMNSIAETAGVARQTLFNRFGSKDRLFREVVQRVFERMMESLLHVQPDRDLAAALALYAHEYLEVAFDPEGIALHRLTISELREFPDLAKLVHSLGVSRAVPVLADHLRDRMAAGEIRQCDPEIVAECFLASVTGHSRHRAMMGTDTDSRARIEARLRVTVDMFVEGLQKR